MDSIEREQKLLTYDGEDKVLPADKVLKLYLSERPATSPILSKLPTLDRIIGGFYKGQLVVVSGITGQGKTTLCQTFTRNMASQMTRPLWFSYEVATDDFLNVFPTDYLEHIYMPTKLKGNTLEWLEERIIESMVKYETSVVFIDHIHYLVEMSSRQNMSFLIGETVRGIKQLALKHNVVVFLVAHMQKTKQDEEPGLGHTRDSSFIEQEADTVLYVWRDFSDKMITICKVAKNRKRGIIDGKIGLVLRFGQYYELEKGEE